MGKYSRFISPPLLLALVAIFFVTSPEQIAYAKKRSRGTAMAKASRKSAKTAKSERGSRRSRAARNEPKVSQKEMQALLKKQRQGKLSRADRRKLAGFRVSAREAARRRAAAIQAARLRAIRAHDDALRNSAAANILKDDATGEDPEIRRAAIEALAGRSGTVVVMDPNNGRVFTVVNQKLGLSSPVKPCSTVKPIVGLAALHEKVFDPNQDVQFAGTSMGLTDALARSNNPFFQTLGRRLGYERVMKYAENFGFGQKTGVNYAGEDDGFLPEEGEEETGHMSSHGDGFGVTAIQMATFTSAIANGGNLYTPRVPRTPEDAANFQPVLRRRIEMTPEDRLRMLAGMIGAVNFGTAKLAYDPIGQVAGKTGTCHDDNGETERNKLGLFTSFSSVDNPKLVVTVIMTGSSEAGKRAAEVAGRVYRSISYRFLREPMAVPASASIELKRGDLKKPASGPFQQ